MSIYQKLMNIQNQLKAPKNQFNSFGNYKYRSCEDILEALKPLLKENYLALIITDTLENVGDRYYIKACAKLIDTETMDYVEVSALAREEESKKGMDASQITGSASSYARKYALNGMFCIDDTKDADSTNTYDKPSQTSQNTSRNGVSSHGKTNGQTSQQTPPTRQNNGSTQNKPQIYCSECTLAIVENALNVKAYSEKHWGRILCKECQKKIPKQV